MKVFFAGLLTVFLGFSMASCDPAEAYKTELTEIDSCLKRIDTLETLFDGIDFDTLQIMVDHVIANEKTIKEIYQPDTLDVTFGRHVNDSKIIRKTLTNLGNKQLSYSDELNAIKNQFMDLEDDIRNGVLTEDQIKTYLNTEKEALRKVDLIVIDFYETQKREKERYYYAVPYVDDYIEKLKTSVEAEE
ncbi:MAG: hypothetical protein ACPG21_09140 [Crocinitomicaceae bacterium]